MSLTGCYSLDLYCDDVRHNDATWTNVTDQYTGRTLAECLKKARRDGWTISRTKLSDDGSPFTRCDRCNLALSQERSSPTQPARDL